MWTVLEPNEEVVSALAAGCQISPFAARLLVNRGLTDVDEAAAFLKPSLASLPDPWLMADAQVAAERIAQAVMAGEQICVYGDYDVDCVSATALMHDFLSRVGAKPMVFLPDRFRDGYGLHPERLMELCDEGVQLFISVDCGSKAVEAIGRVRERGVDFIVVDHHLLGETSPNATALLNPRRPDCTYPDEGLCAVGVALVLVQGLRRSLVAAGHCTRQTAPGIGDLLQLAALGTIADMVPLRHINRVLAWHGLRRLGSSTRPGVRALAEKARLTGKVAADHVGFALGPRINAAGRVASAQAAFDLLTTEDPGVATELAERVELENGRRRRIQGEVVEAALVAAEAQPGREHAIVVAGEGWHSGVVGIVAARLKDRYNVPTFVLSLQDGVARGSGRSIPGYDLVAGLDALQSSALPTDALFSRYGGHYFAAGVTLPGDHITAFREGMVAHVASTLPVSDRVRELQVDAELDVAALQLGLVDELHALEPFGKGNRKPLFLVRGSVLAEARRVGQDGAWLKAKLVEGDSDRPMWGRRGVGAFGSAALLDATGHDGQPHILQAGDRVDAVCRLEANHFRGQTSLQATLVALAVADTVTVGRRAPGVHAPRSG
ncbi:MAG: single-stranded-DNA-specific exonuclease RecJ [Myxococcales bacterium]|nr:single-stranded-DNA-specific exonuclease RecJ [Myxococcales bacterium]